MDRTLKVIFVHDKIAGSKVLARETIIGTDIIRMHIARSSLAEKQRQIPLAPKCTFMQSSYPRTNNFLERPQPREKTIGSI